MKLRRTTSLIVFFLCVANIPLCAMERITVVIPPNVLEHPVSGSATADAVNLLQKACSCPVIQVYPATFDTKVELILPDFDLEAEEIPSEYGRKARFPYLEVPSRRYKWISRPVGDRIRLELQAATPQAISAGLYGLLQELLGFEFYHPRETIIPELGSWPLPPNFSFEADPRFDKMGFHLHTQHPLELTEPLLDHKTPYGLAEIRQYIDWLARNGQNYFEFNLLEGISKRKWPMYAREFVDYAHSRGILAGVDISLHMIQQKAWMLYKMPLKSFRPKLKQVEKNLDWLMQADWDVLNCEFSTTEFTGGNEEKKTQLQLAMLRKLNTDYPDTKLMGRVHVVKEETKLDGEKPAKKGRSYEMTAEEKELDAGRGESSHTVMFYGLTDQKAPVYGNENLLHMKDLLVKNRSRRETWYYPESAYWVSFDNSVPLFLTSYLSARLDDILLVDSLNIPGHLTFSSGWEWGYWLFDWSIARWSWEYRYNGEALDLKPEMYATEMMNHRKIDRAWASLIALQDKWIKEKELIRYLCAQTVTDEIRIMDLQLQPEPELPYRELRRKVQTEAYLKGIEQHFVRPLDEVGRQLIALSDTLVSCRNEIPEGQVGILDEWVDAVRITGLRSIHRSKTLEFLIRRNREKAGTNIRTKSTLRILDEAKKIRAYAQVIVDRRQQSYRYPLRRIAEKRPGHTAYHFGYLYPVSNLHFWKREEEQARHNRWGPLYRNIWNIPRIIGAID